jgi:hypothetical protein
MAVKYKKVTVKSPSFLLKEIRDFMVNDVGWTDETPANQDDYQGFILGYFLKSTGESGDKEIFLNPRLNCFQFDATGDDNYLAQRPAVYNYLSSAIDENDMTISLDEGAHFPPASQGLNGLVVRIEDELIKISDVSGDDLTVEQRGYRDTHSSLTC